MSAVPWYQGSYEDIAARVRAGVGSAAGARAQELWSQAKSVVDDCDALIISTVRSNAGAWAGRAADEFHSALEPLSAWVVDASADATTMVNAVVAQGGHADEFRRLLPDPPPTGGRLDWVQVRQTVATDDAQRLALAYAQHTADNRNALSLWSTPPAVTVDVRPPATASGAAAAAGAGARAAGSGVVAVSAAGAAATGARPPPASLDPAAVAATPPAARLGPDGGSAASASDGGSTSPAGDGKAAGGEGDVPAPGLAVPTAAGLGGSGGLTPPATGDRAMPSGAASTMAKGAGDAAWTAGNGARSAARSAENGAGGAASTAEDGAGGAGWTAENGAGRAGWPTGNGAGGAAERSQGGAADLDRAGRPMAGGIDAETFRPLAGSTAGEPLGLLGGQSGSLGAGADRIPGVTRAVPGYGGVDGLAPGVGGRGSFAPTPRPGPSGESGVSGWRDLVAGQPPADPIRNAATTDRAGGFYPPMTGGTAGGQGSTHRRPEYLLDDSGAFADNRWIGPAVITPDDPLPGGPGS